MENTVENPVLNRWKCLQMIGNNYGFVEIRKGDLGGNEWLGKVVDRFVRFFSFVSFHNVFIAFLPGKSYLSTVRQ